MGHPDVGSLAFWGGVCCGFAGLILAGMTVGEVKRARNTLRKVTASGRVTYEEETTDKYGDVRGKVIQVAFTAASGLASSSWKTSMNAATLLVRK
jgi:hypothetical protein